MSIKRNIGIINYESGNIRSVVNAIEYLGYNIVLTDKYSQLKSCSHLILPGVGSFGEVMNNLRRKGLIDTLNELILNQKHYILAICVGMQILADIGEEFGEHQGLGWVRAKNKKLDVKEVNLRLPHVGWNEIVNYTKNFALFRDISDPTFYFTHSYALFIEETLTSEAYTMYGETFLAALQKDNIFGTQFHPEKSQSDGLKLLKNFCKI